MLETLGINPITLIVQIINFAVVYFAFSKFLYPQLKSALDERKAAVGKTIADQAAIETRLAEFDKQQKAAQKKAAEDVQKLMTEAKDAAEVTKQGLVAKAKEEAAVEIMAAQKRIEQDKAGAEAEVAKHANSIAQSIVKQLLTEKAADGI